MKRGSSPVRRGKLRRPKAAELHLPRPALVQRLQAIVDHPVSLVCAPAGAGKTALVRDWAEASRGPVAWLSLDAQDADLPRLLRHVIASVRTVRPEVGGAAEALLDSGGAPTPSAAAAALAEDLDASDEDCVLVLDDYDQVPGPEIQDFLSHLLEPPPRSLHLVIVTRVEPPLRLHGLRGRGLLLELRLRDLAFTAEEARALLAEVGGGALTDAQVATIHERFRGWAAGIWLLGLSLREHGDSAALLERLPHGIPQIQDYLRVEVFERQAPEMQDQLLRCSILDRFTGPLCESLSPPEDGDAMPSEFLKSAGFQQVFVERLDGPWFQLVPAFRDFLRTQREERLDPGEIQDIHDRAAAWFDQHDHVREAVEHALRGRDPGSAVGIVASHRVSMLNEGRIGELVHLASRLPEAAITNDLDALLLRAWGAPSPLTAEAVERVEAALDAGVTSPENADHVRGEVCFLQTAAKYSASLERAIDLPGMVATAREALRLLPRTYREARAGAAHLLAQALQMSGDVAGALAVLDAAEEEQGLVGGQPLLTVRYARCLVHYSQADLADARDAAAACIETSRGSPGQTTWVEPAHMMLARVHYAWDELEDAERILLRPDVGPSPAALGLLAQVRQARGRPREASATVEELVAVANKAADPGISTFVHAVEAEVALHQGRLDAALDWARGVQPARVRPFPTALRAMTTRAWILTLGGGEGQQGTADAAVGDLVQVAEALQNHPALIAAYLLQALLHTAEGDEGAAQVAVSRSLGLAAPGRIVRLYLDAGRRAYGLLLHLAAPPGLEDYLRKLRSAFRAEGGQPTRSANETLLDPLTDRELEILTRLAQRLTNKELAAELHISVATVKKHLATINQKLYVHGRRDAVLKARSLGLVPPA